MQYAERNGENPIALAVVGFLALTGRLNEGGSNCSVLMFGAELFPPRACGRAATFGYTANRLTLALIPLIGLRLIHGTGDRTFYELRWGIAGAHGGDDADGGHPRP